MERQQGCAAVSDEKQIRTTPFQVQGSTFNVQGLTFNVQSSKFKAERQAKKQTDNTAVSLQGCETVRLLAI